MGLHISDMEVGTCRVSPSCSGRLSSIRLSEGSGNGGEASKEPPAFQERPESDRTSRPKAGAGGTDKLSYLVAQVKKEHYDGLM